MRQFWPVAVDFPLVSKVLSSLTCSSSLSSRYSNFVPNMLSATIWKSNLSRKIASPLVQDFWIAQRMTTVHEQSRCAGLVTKAQTDSAAGRQQYGCLQNISEDCACPPCQSCRCTAAAVCPGHLEHSTRVAGHMDPHSQQTKGEEGQRNLMR